MYAFSYSILYPKVLGLRGIIKISTAPYKPGCICACMLAKMETRCRKRCYTDEKIMLSVYTISDIGNFEIYENESIYRGCYVPGRIGT